MGGAITPDRFVTLAYMDLSRKAKSEYTEAGLESTQEVLMRKLLGALTIVAIGAVVLHAHHGWTGYDETKIVQLTGVIKESGYENPHGFVTLEVDKKIWRIVLAPPSRMESRGLPKEKLKLGGSATIAGYVHKQTKDEIRAERITIDGKTTELR
jgi:hypothetical protein